MFRRMNPAEMNENFEAGEQLIEQLQVEQAKVATLEQDVASLRNEKFELQRQLRESQDALAAANLVDFRENQTEARVLNQFHERLLRLHATLGIVH